MKKYYVVIVAVLAVVVTGIPSKLYNCPASGNKRFPDKTNCTVYYECQNGTLITRICPEGLHFNNAIKQCDWPPAGCVPEKSHPETQPNIPEKDDSKEGDSKDDDKNKSNESKENDTQFCIGTCPDEESTDKTIHLPYKGDCSKFCTCSYGSKYVQKCPANLHFDEKKSLCNYPRDANCPWRTKSAI